MAQISSSVNSYYIIIKPIDSIDLTVWLNGRASDYESGGCGFKSRYGRFLEELFFIMGKIKCSYYSDVINQ
jgi:hypothetical protein